MRIVVTKHAMDRARARLGLPRKAVQRAAEQAWMRGVPVAECVPNFSYVLKERVGGRWLLDVRGDESCVVTVLKAKVPDDMREGVRRSAEYHHHRERRRQDNRSGQRAARARGRLREEGSADV